jgi:hypothetical protein
MNKAVMSKAHEEGGDWTSSERLASAFLTLGIGGSAGTAEAGSAGMAEAGNAVTTAGEEEIEMINGPENEPATYKAVLRSARGERVGGSHTPGAARVDWKPYRQTEGNEESIGCKWVYRRKINPNGSTRYMARLVIKGYAQKEGIDYGATDYALVS